MTDRVPTEMELRVARAMHDEANAKYGQSLEENPGGFLWIRSARTAIRAMREPTDLMCNVGDGTIATSEVGPADIERAWQRMIDIASPPDGA